MNRGSQPFEVALKAGGEADREAARRASANAAHGKSLYLEGDANKGLIPCQSCHGDGRIKHNKVLEVTIPAGIDEGQRIRLSGKGEPGVNGGPPGDLYVEIRIKPHEVFQRDGDDLHCEVPISIAAAALGGEIEVGTLKEKVSIAIPEGTQSGKTFRLRGKGIKGLRSSYPGDLYCHVRVETPVRLTEKQKKLLREFEHSIHEGGAKHSPQAKSFMDKMKGFFAAE